MNRPDNSPAAVAARRAVHMADPTSAAALVRMEGVIQYAAIQMAVVDYIGFKYQNARGEVVTVDEYTCTAERFGTRCLAHVAVYGFPVISYNPAALVALDMAEWHQARNTPAVQIVD